MVEEKLNIGSAAMPANSLSFEYGFTLAPLEGLTIGLEIGLGKQKTTS